MDFKKGHSYYNYKQTIISSNHIKDEDVSKLWEILGRIADDADNPIYPSEDAEIFIGYYEWLKQQLILLSVPGISYSVP